MPATEMVTLESKFVTVEDTRIHYQEMGQGPVVVCIHGGGPGSNALGVFKQNVPALSQRFRVILYDMPQFGKSQKVVIPEPRLAYNARILAGVLQKLHIDRISIIGSSVGGQVGLKFGIDFADRLERLIVLGSTPLPPILAPSPAEGIKLIIAFYKGTGPSREKLRSILEANVYDPSWITTEFFEERYALSTDPETVKLFSELQPNIPYENLGPDLHKLTAKLLVIWGMDDRMGALDVGLQMTRLVPDSRMCVYNRCGHYPQLEHAAEFNRLATEFLSADSDITGLVM